MRYSGGLRRCSVLRNEEFIQINAPLRGSTRLKGVSATELMHVPHSTADFAVVGLLVVAS